MAELVRLGLHGYMEELEMFRIRFTDIIQRYTGLRGHRGLIHKILLVPTIFPVWTIDPNVMQVFTKYYVYLRALRQLRSSPDCGALLVNIGSCKGYSLVEGKEFVFSINGKGYRAGSLEHVFRVDTHKKREEIPSSELEKGLNPEEEKSWLEELFKDLKTSSCFRNRTILVPATVDIEAGIALKWSSGLMNKARKDEAPTFVSKILRVKEPQDEEQEPEGRFILIGTSNTGRLASKLKLSYNVEYIPVMTVNVTMLKSVSRALMV